MVAASDADRRHRALRDGHGISSQSHNGRSPLPYQRSRIPPTAPPPRSCSLRHGDAEAGSSSTAHPGLVQGRRAASAACALAPSRMQASSAERTPGSPHGWPRLGRRRRHRGLPGRGRSLWCPVPRSARARRFVDRPAVAVGVGEETEATPRVLLDPATSTPRSRRLACCTSGEIARLRPPGSRSRADYGVEGRGAGGGSRGSGAGPAERGRLWAAAGARLRHAARRAD